MTPQHGGKGLPCLNPTVATETLLREWAVGRRREEERQHDRDPESSTDVRCVFKSLHRKGPLTQMWMPRRGEWQLQTQLPGPQKMRSIYWTQTTLAHGGPGWQFKSPEHHFRNLVFGHHCEVSQVSNSVLAGAQTPA